MIERSRETYAKLDANTSGPSHQGQTSTEAQAALDELDKLRGVDKHDVHTWFSLSYSNFVVLHRSILQSMPEHLQHRFTSLMDEIREEFEGNVPEPEGGYMLTAKDARGRWMKDPIPPYDRGRTHIPCKSNP